MRFAAPEEPADPGCLLLPPPQSIDVLPEHPLQAVGVFAIADESLQLKAQGLDLALVLAEFRNLRDAVIQQLEGCGIAEVQFAVGHGVMKLSVEVIGTAM